MLRVIAMLSNLTVIHRMIYTWQEAKRLEEAQPRVGPQVLTAGSAKRVKRSEPRFHPGILKNRA